MRTIIDITDDQVKALDELSQIEGTSRTALIRQAIDRMLVEEVRIAESAGAAFGLWLNRQKNEKASAKPPQRSKKPPVVVEVVAAPPVEPPPVIVDSFVTTEPPTDTPPPVAEDVPAPPVKEAAMTTVDPLAAFFAGVKP